RLRILVARPIYGAHPAPHLGGRGGVQGRRVVVGERRVVVPLGGPEAMDLSADVQIVGLLGLDRDLAGEERDALLVLSAFDFVLEPVASQRARLLAPLGRVSLTARQCLGELLQRGLALLRRRMTGEETALRRIAARPGLELEQEVTPDFGGLGGVVAGL